MLMGSGQNRPERKRSNILAAARDVFLRQGYADAGMGVVARAANVSTATLYAYFPSKAKLFEVVVQETLGDMARPVRDSAAAEGDARARLLALSRAYAALASDPATRAMFRLVTTERRRFEDLADLFLQSARDQLGRAAMLMIDDLAQAGELAVDKPSWAAGQLLGMLDHATLVLGLAAGDHVRPGRALEAICQDAVETFLARYGRPPLGERAAQG